MKKKLLVFPCGSEVALEIYRSMQYSLHFELVGGSSVDDHGKFVYENYIGDLPFHSDPAFISTLKNIIREENIDGIFPAMDAVARTLKSKEDELGCVVIGSSPETTAICSSKRFTYLRLDGHVKCPMWRSNLCEVDEYPIFIKPDEGYGSRNVYKAVSRTDAQNFIEDRSSISFVFCEYLPGDEYTIDCFSNSEGELLFHGARHRTRVSNGISVHAVEAHNHQEVFQHAAEAINRELRPRGAWFFQMKENKSGEPVLLEVAARLGGSSSYFRAKGINFALLSAFDAFGVQVNIDANHYTLELDRALGVRYKLGIKYETAYIDFDDCLLLEGRVNGELVKYIYEAINNGIKVVLITRHVGDIHKTLKKYRLADIFDDIIHIHDERAKSEFIDDINSVFVDDSFRERAEVRRKHGIPVFSPDMVEVLSSGV